MKKKKDTETFESLLKKEKKWINNPQFSEGKK